MCDKEHTRTLLKRDYKDNESQLLATKKYETCVESVMINLYYQILKNAVSEHIYKDENTVQ